jgi:hypothetical protein
VVPQIRAALPLESLRVLERLTGDGHARVLGRLQPDTLAHIRGAGRLDWLPLALDLELSATIIEQLGPELDRSRSRACVRSHLDQPLLRPFVYGVETLFGRTPAAMIAAVPRGWPMLYRNAGALRYEVTGALRRVLIYQDMPRSLAEQPSYLDAIAASLESLFDLCGVDGRVTVERVDAAARTADFVCEWE